MPHPFPVATSFSGGMRRDFDRAAMPGNSAWNLVDYIPDELGAPLRGRGGWSYAGGALSGATSINSLVYAPFSAGVKTFGIDQAGKLWDIIAATSPGTVQVPGSNPRYYRGKVYIPDTAGAAVPKTYDGTTIATMAGGTPAGMYFDLFKDHGILARSASNDNRIWFSAAGDPTTWDTTAGWWDTSKTLTGIAPMKAFILLFHKESTERLRGNVPPPGTDMILEPAFDVGCLDPFSIAYWGDRVIFAGAKGIFLTDGSTPVNVSERAGMSTYWQSLLASYTSSWRIAGGVYREHYVVSITNGSTLVDCLVLDLNSLALYRFSNIVAKAFLNFSDGPEECFFGQANAGRAGKLSSCWAPTASVKNDADGTTPAPILETHSMRGFDRLHRRWISSMGQQKWEYLYANYDLRDAASDAPTLTVSYTLNPEAGAAYTVLTPNLAKTSKPTRSKLSINKRENSIAFKIAQTGPSADSRLYGLEMVYEPIGVGRIGG